MPDTPPPASMKMKDLALLAGCSVNTVSQALRNSHRISEPLRERIKQLAIAHGYRPNPLVSALMSSRRKALPTQTLAVLTKFPYPLFTQPEKAEYYTLQLLEGLRQKAQELGFRLEEFPTAMPGAPSAERLSKILMMRGIRGVMLFPSGDFTVSFPELDWQHFAVVAAGFHSRHLTVHRTSINWAHSTTIALEKLQSRGFQRIALATTRYLDPRMQFSCSGRFLAWQLQQPKKNRIPIIPVEREGATDQEVEDWVLAQRPDAMLIYYDSTIDHIRKLARQHRFKIELVGMHATNRRDFPRVDTRSLHLGRTSISVLARELYLNHYGLPEVPEVTLVSGIWQEADNPDPTPAAAPSTAKPAKLKKV
ncbi:MAG: LacI family DNA-binding transcriptional regulator [Opitutaceae bacterium]|nr:LacI family DNA-binding transcriptional regulator [Opitutaceae bacterium]